MSVSLSPVFNDAQLDPQGIPANRYRVWVVLAATNTPTAVYRTVEGDDPHENPIVLGPRGEPPDPIWITDGETVDMYFMSPTDIVPPGSPIRTVRDVSGIGQGSGSGEASPVDEWLLTGFAPTFLSATSFSVIGNQTDLYHVGRRIRAFTAGGVLYGKIDTSVFSVSTTTITATMDAGSLDSSLSRVDVGFLSAINTSVPTFPSGPQGPQGIQGIPGPTGPTGPAGAGIAPTLTAFGTGSFTWTRPAGCKAIWVRVYGGGAGGGGCIGPATGNFTGGGGGAGGSFKESLIQNPSASYPLTVGAGGVGGFGGADGGTGGTTSFGGGLVGATGGLGGKAGISAANTPTIIALGGTPGAVVTAISGAGDAGGYGLVLPGQVISGKGGFSVISAGGQSVFATSGTSANGNNASSFSGGGSGAASGQASTPRNGGNGGGGLCLVMAFF